MPISDKYSFIFVHNPKTAGDRVASDKSIFDVLAGGHHPAVKLRKMVGRDRFERYFSAAFVRNPYDRVVSAYHYLKDMTTDHRWYPFDVNRVAYIRQFDDFEHFCSVFFRFPVAQMKVGHMLHFMPQHAFICDRMRRPIVNYIGRFEALQEGWDEICRNTGIPPVDYSPGSRSNASSHDDFRCYYSAKVLRRVNRFYRLDFELFGYPQMS